MTRVHLRILPMVPDMRSPTTERTPEPDLAQMERWAAWVIRLTSHAAIQTPDADIRERLEGATADAASLRGALAAAACGSVDPERVAIIRSVYALWDANHDRTERLAAAVDPGLHRRWRMRSAGARPAIATTVESSLSAVS